MSNLLKVSISTSEGKEWIWTGLLDDTNLTKLLEVVDILSDESVEGQNEQT